MSMDVPDGAGKADVRMTEHLEGELTARTLTNGRIDSVTVKVTAGKSTSSTPKGSQEALPDSVGKEYTVTRVDGGTNQVERTDGAKMQADEGSDARRLANKLFDKRVSPILAGRGDAIDAADILGAPDAGATMSGTMSLGLSTTECAAPFTGTLTGTSVRGNTTMAMAMTGDVCVDPSTGLVSKSELRGTINAGTQGTGTVHFLSTAKKM